MSDSKQQALDTLEKYAPEAAEKLAASLKSGTNQKKDKSYEAALEILDRTGISKKSEQTIHHEGNFALPPESLAAALSLLGKMFDVEPELETVSTTWEPVPPSEITQQPDVPSPSNVPEQDNDNEQEPTSLDDVPFSLDPSIGASDEED